MHEMLSGRERAAAGRRRGGEKLSGLAHPSRGARVPPASDGPAAGQRTQMPSGELMRVDAGGTRLRIRALHAMGHCSARIARAARTSEQMIQKLARGGTRTISPDLRDAVVSVYEAWWDKRPPETTQAQKAAAATARRRAARGNWCAGAGLDDDLLDRPGYRPDCGWKPARGTGIAGSDDRVPGTKGNHMSCDPRQTTTLIADVLTVLHQHGYRPGDRVHTRRAARLIGDMARIYQGTQDAPTGAYLIEIPAGHRNDDCQASGGDAGADPPGHQAQDLAVPGTRPGARGTVGQGGAP